MRQNQKIVTNTGIGSTEMLTIIFVVLKLTKVITWPWLWVLSPLWISLLLWVCFLIIFFLIVIIFKL